MITIEAANRALYIDFEGPRTPPSLATVLFATDAGHLIHEYHIIEEALHGAVPLADGSRISTMPELASRLRDQATLEGRSIYAWSSYEADRFSEALPDDEARFAESVENARTIADRWMSQRQPRHESRNLKKGKRNRLQVFLDLVGYQPRLSDPEFQPITGIDEMRTALADSGGAARPLTESSVTAWHKTLAKNYDDCAGMRAVLTHIATFEAALPEPGPLDPRFENFFAGLLDSDDSSN